MLMPDVNVLVYAHREDEAAYPTAKGWIEATVNGSEPFALSVLVMVGFVRIVTNPRIYSEPTPTPVALAAVDTMLVRPNCRVIIPGPRHWQLVTQLCRNTQAVRRDLPSCFANRTRHVHPCRIEPRRPPPVAPCAHAGRTAGRRRPCPGGDGARGGAAHAPRHHLQPQRLDHGARYRQCRNRYAHPRLHRPDRPFANSKSEAIYLQAYTGNPFAPANVFAGQPIQRLEGGKHYRIRGTDIPSAWWSITLS